jgi:copper transport protein
VAAALTRRRIVVAAVVGLVAALGGTAPAVAHTFLTRSSPEPGARLTTAPTEIVLDFTAPVAADAVVQLWTSEGNRVELTALGRDDDRSLVRAGVPALVDGAYRVAWRVTAGDGHTVEGEYAFAVGVDLPPGTVVASTGGATSPVDALAAMLLVGGVAVALGGLASERWIWRERPITAAPAPVGAAVALAGAVGTLAVRLDRRDALSAPGHWPDALTARSDRLLLLAVGALLVAVMLVTRPHLRRATLAWLVLAAVAVVAAGHAGDSDHWSTLPATTLHVLAGGVWVGALVHLTRSARHAQGDLVEAARRYSRGAAIAVAVVVPLGVAAAAGLLTAPGELVGTAYGRVLTIKLGMLVIALAIGATARRRGLPASGRRRGRLAGLTAAETVAVAGVVAASAVLATTAPGTVSGIILQAAPLSPPTTWMSDLAGNHQVLLAATRANLRIRVLPPDDRPTDDIEINVTAVDPDGTIIDLDPRGCGPGCRELARRWQTGTTTFTVAVRGGAFTPGAATLPITWPPGPDATALLQQAIDATRTSGILTVTETVSSGPGATSGPYRLNVDGEDFIAAQPFAGSADDVHRLPDDDGLTVLTFVVTGANTWHQLWLDQANRIRRAVLVDPGHRVDDTIEQP